MRLSRIKFTDQTAVYHCMSRIVAGHALLENGDREQLRKIIWQQADFCGIQILTYCVLSNHFHVLIRVPGPCVMGDQELLRRVKRLYGEGHKQSVLLETSIQETGRLSEEQRKELEARMGDVSAFMKELKQRFSRWFNGRSDGVAFGSKEFVNGVFMKYRDRFGPRRKDGARPIRVAALKGMNTLRDLKVSVFE